MRQPDRGAEPSATARKSWRILVADDEEGTLVLMSTMLAYAGFTVVAARDGLEALLRARESAPDLALLDVMMPGLDGREVCRRMSADPALAHVPVILESAADERDIEWRACGAVAFLPKPFNIRELPGLVQQHLRARPPGHQQGSQRLTDDEIQEIARQIRQAVRQPPSSNPRDAVLSPHRELSSEDEARVEAALIALFRGADEAPGDAGRTGHTRGKKRRAERKRGDHGPA